MAYKRQKLASHSYGDGQLHDGAGAFSVLVGACIWVHQGHRVAVSSRGGRGEGVLWGLFYKNTNPIDEGPTLMT